VSGVIKYLGSKRRLVPALGRLFEASGAATALDLFTGTTRVAQELKRRGGVVWACDSARYSEVLGACYVAADAATIDEAELDEALGLLNRLPGVHGYFTETFCVKSRYFQPFNGRRVDAVRSRIADDFSGSWLEPLLLTSLLEAADRVDSTTGVQMAYLKSWAPRSYNPLELRAPALIPGTGYSLRADAAAAAASVGSVDFAYLDPPYNQHSYFGNYHIWETLVAWDRPPVYGVACKRSDCRDPANRSRFNSKPRFRDALAEIVRLVDAGILVLSYNDESWTTLEEITELCAKRGAVRVLTFDSKRYVGAQIGIHNPAGKLVGRVSHLHNHEYLVISGEQKDVMRAAAGVTDAGDACCEVVQP